MGAASGEPPLLCFSHLRSGFVHQRPQHLMWRFALQREVFFIEEPWPEPVTGPAHLDLYPHQDRPLTIVTPRLPGGLSSEEATGVLSGLLKDLLASAGVTQFDAWYTTPMLLPAARSLAPRAVAYDCMDELQNFTEAPPELAVLERELLERADVVFTGGRSLFHAKRSQRADAHLVRSGVEREHFAQARRTGADPPEQQAIPRPRLGYFGVIDERVDLDLLDRLARARPDWSIVMLGPVLKIPLESLPRAANLHYLGLRGYQDLPRYIRGWDVALMPFARNAATRYISPTKTLEYLAAGRPVVSTPVHDVVADFAGLEAVTIADAGAAFEGAVAQALTLSKGADRRWLAQVDKLLTDRSWDRIHRRVARLFAAAAVPR